MNFLKEILSLIDFFFPMESGLLFKLFFEKFLCFWYMTGRKKQLLLFCQKTKTQIPFKFSLWLNFPIRNKNIDPSINWLYEKKLF